MLSAAPGMGSDTSDVLTATAGLVVFGVAAVFGAVLVLTGDSGVGKEVDQVYAWVPLGVGGAVIAVLAAIAATRGERRYLIASGGVGLGLLAYVVILSWLAADH